MQAKANAISDFAFNLSETLHSSFKPDNFRDTESLNVGFQNTINYKFAKILKMNSKQLNILLAEDDQDDRDFFDNALKGIPIPTHLTTVCDGEQLMEYLYKNSEHLPDVLFLDLNMPRKNGFECLVEIKENEMLKDIPVVMFSTSYPRDILYENDMIKRLLKIGAQDFFRKTENLAQLKEFIHQIINRATEKKVLGEKSI